MRQEISRPPSLAASDLGQASFSASDARLNEIFEAARETCRRARPIRATEGDPDFVTGTLEWNRLPLALNEPSERPADHDPQFAVTAGDKRRRPGGPEFAKRPEHFDDTVLLADQGPVAAGRPQRAIAGSMSGGELHPLLRRKHEGAALRGRIEGHDTIGSDDQHGAIATSPGYDSGRSGTGIS